ncbi:hypothetical protein PV325_012093 [Microctonus aethiopoides]|nr:hypothetical protein PV325_012093 [Microctonus aethiopoides]
MTSADMIVKAEDLFRGSIHKRSCHRPHIGRLGCSKALSYSMLTLMLSCWLWRLARQVLLGTSASSVPTSWRSDTM